MAGRERWKDIFARRTVVSSAVMLLGVACSMPASASAQAAAPGLLDSLVVALESPPPEGSAPDLTRCRRHRGDLRSLCEGLTLLRHAVPAPDSMSFRHPYTGELLLRLGGHRGPHPFHRELQDGYRHAVEGQHRLGGVRGAYPGVVGYAQARLELAKGAPADSVAALLEQARAGGGLAPGVLDLLAARLAFREGDTVVAWRAWDRMLADTASVTGAVAWALLRESFPRALVQRWEGQVNTAALAELSVSPMHRSLVAVYLGQVPMWIPVEAYGRGYVVFRQGAPMWVGVFALPRQQLVWEVPSAEEEVTVRALFPIQVEMVWVPEVDGATLTHTVPYRIRSRWPMPERLSLAERQGQMRVTNCGRFVTSDGKLGCGWGFGSVDSQATGLVVQRGLAPGPSVVTVALRQAGGASTLQTFVPRAVPPADAAGLFASDLVLGLPGRGYTWRSMERLVPMHPTGIYPVGSELSLFAQVRGMVPEVRYQVLLEILAGETERSGEAPALTLRMTEEASGSEIEWYRQMQLNALKPGGYRVRVTFQQGEQVVVREDHMWVVR